MITDAFMGEIRGQLRGVTGASLWNKFTKILGLPMSEIERFNRASLAAYRARIGRHVHLPHVQPQHVRHVGRALKIQGRAGAPFCAKSIGASISLGRGTALSMYATLMALFQPVTGDADDWTEMIRNYLTQNNLLRHAVCCGAAAIAGLSIGGSLKMETPLTKG